MHEIERVNFHRQKLSLLPSLTVFGNTMLVLLVVPLFNIICLPYSSGLLGNLEVNIISCTDIQHLLCLAHKTYSFKNG
jgi:hypothetical protein